MNKLISTKRNYVAPTHSTDRFTYDKVGRTFCAEASDFNDQQLDGQLFDDACDVGLLLENPKTGNVVPFVWTGTTKDEEGDVLFATYEADCYAVRRNPALAGLQVIIFND